MLLGIAENCALVYKKQFLNQDTQVLIEARSKEKPGFWEGHADNYIKVRVVSEKNLENQLLKVRLKKLDQDFVRADFC